MAKKVNVTLPNVNSLNFQIKLEGDWVKVSTAMSRLAPDIQDGYDRAVVKFSNDLLKIVRRSMVTGTPPPRSGITWEPLSPSTIKRWGKHPIYYLTGLYCNSVGLFKYKSRILVGLPINTRKSSNKNLTLNQLAKILEYGTTDLTIPARPLWRPSLESAGGLKKLRKDILTNIRSNLTHSFGIKPNQVKW